MACRALCRPTSSSWIDGGGWVVFSSTCSAMESLCLCRVCPVMGRSLTSMLAARLSRLAKSLWRRRRSIAFSSLRPTDGWPGSSSSALHCIYTHSLHRTRCTDTTSSSTTSIRSSSSRWPRPSSSRHPHTHETAAQSHASHRSAAAQIDMRIGRRSSRDGAAGRGILAVAAATVLVLCCSCISTVSGGCWNLCTRQRGLS